MKKPLVVAIVILLASTSARAAERAAAEWQFDAKASYVVLGAHAARATGGIMPSLTGWRTWFHGEAVEISIGADVGVFGLGGMSRWLGVLGGPAASVRGLPFSMPSSGKISSKLPEKARRKIDLRIDGDLRVRPQRALRHLEPVERPPKGSGGGHEAGAASREAAHLSERKRRRRA